MTTYYDLYEDNPWRKVAEISQEELQIPGMICLQEKLGRCIVPQIAQDRPNRELGQLLSANKG